MSATIVAARRASRGSTAQTRRITYILVPLWRSGCGSELRAQLTGTAIDRGRSTSRTPRQLGEEFHHNRISIVGSPISGVAPRLQHRWDELRMSDTAMGLEREGRLLLEPLISHVVDADSAPNAFAMLDTSPEAAMQVVLDYGASS